MIRKTCLIVSMITLLALCSCEDNPSEFEPEPEPGKRNYVWTLDTLDMPMNYISSVWGASPDDVWAVGGGGTQYDRLLHYDGTEWTTYTNETIWCSGFTLFGFSADDVWMGGGAGWLEHGAGIWHYDGAEWKQNYVYSIEEDYYSINIYDMWGTSPNDVYACGVISFFDGTNECWRGFVLHYDGTNWREMARADFNSQFLRIRAENDKVYVFSYGINYETGDGDVEFYQVVDNELQQIYSNKESIISWAGISSIYGKVYFTVGNDVFYYKSNDFKKFISINMNNFYRPIFGRNEKDIFICMKDGIVHYNGTDMEYLYKLPTENISFVGDPLILEKDIIFSILCPGPYDLVLHGKLVE
ncbi:hypothetical protein FMIA91_20740 [Fidelibacter multiformis]